MPKPKNHDFDFLGNWSYGEEVEISRLIDGLDDALVGLQGRTWWQPDTFVVRSNEEALRGEIALEVYQGHLIAGQLIHRACGHLPANWIMDDGIFLVLSQDEKILDEYAVLTGTEVFSADLGRETGIFSAIIRNMDAELEIKPTTVWLAFLGSYRCPRPLFGYPEPINAVEDPR